MKIINLNAYGNEKSVQLAEKISVKYFSDINTTVGIIKSNKYHSPLVSREPVFANTISRKDLLITIKTFGFLEELKKIDSIKAAYIIWLDSYFDTRDINLEIIAHELKHVQQMILSPKISVKAQALDILFSSLRNPALKSPNEIDSKKFEEIVSKGLGEPPYDWEGETLSMFKKYKVILEKLIFACKNPSKESVVNVSEEECIDTKSIDENLLEWIIKILDKALRK